MVSEHSDLLIRIAFLTRLRKLLHDDFAIKCTSVPFHDLVKIWNGLVNVQRIPEVSVMLQEKVIILEQEVMELLRTFYGGAQEGIFRKVEVLECEVLSSFDIERQVIDNFWHVQVPKQLDGNQF